MLENKYTNLENESYILLKMKVGHIIFSKRHDFKEHLGKFSFYKSTSHKTISEGGCKLEKAFTVIKGDMN